jgi:hypothetical protein
MLPGIHGTTMFKTPEVATGMSVNAKKEVMAVIVIV